MRSILRVECAAHTGLMHLLGFSSINKLLDSQDTFKLSRKINKRVIHF